METNNHELSARMDGLEKAIAELKRIVLKQPNEDFKPLDSNKGDFDFNLNERAFVKRYASGQSGPRKFTLLVAYLSKGDPSRGLELSEIIFHWNKMTSKNLLGKFNRFFSNEAKNQGWVDSKQYGQYSLTGEWQSAIQKKEVKNEPIK